MTRSVVRLAFLCQAEALACAVDLEIPNCSLWVYSCEAVGNLLARPNISRIGAHIREVSCHSSQPKYPAITAQAVGSPTNFGCRICQTIQGGRFAAAGLSHKANEGISRHFVICLLCVLWMLYNRPEGCIFMDRCPSFPDKLFRGYLIVNPCAQLTTMAWPE
jgi:hypothetical protein